MNGVSLTYSPTLLFKTSRDCFSVSTFHLKCDGKGATIVFIKSTSGAVFGGYSKVTWDSNDRSVSDSSAFIYSLISSNKEERFAKMPLKNVNDINAKVCYGNYGPTFGNGHDIYIADSSNTNTLSYSNPCYAYNCDQSLVYGSAEAKAYMAGAMYFQVSEIEVYTF